MPTNVDNLEISWHKDHTLTARKAYNTFSPNPNMDIQFRIYVTYLIYKKKHFSTLNKSRKGSAYINMDME